jgi:type IV pilus biogenesis protein CpaD/CtpE
MKTKPKILAAVRIVWARPPRRTPPQLTAEKAAMIETATICAQPNCQTNSPPERSRPNHNLYRQAHNRETDFPVVLRLA